MSLLPCNYYAFVHLPLWALAESHRRHMGTEERFEQEYLEYLQFFVQ